MFLVLGFSPRELFTLAAMIDSQNYQISRESLTDRLTSVYSELASTGAASGMKSRPFVRHSLRPKLSDR